jgi:hypothetical protein
MRKDLPLLLSCVGASCSEVGVPLLLVEPLARFAARIPQTAGRLKGEQFPPN